MVDDFQSDTKSLWHVLHVRPRCEKKVADYCKVEGVEHYLPLRKESKIYQRRKVVTEKPLFPSYVFANFNARQRLGLLKTKQVVKILEVNDQERLKRDLAGIRMALDADPGLSPCSRVTQGDMVKIISGPFAGIEGVVEKTKNRLRIVLNVVSIGQGVALEVETDMIERI